MQLLNAVVLATVQPMDAVIFRILCCISTGLTRPLIASSLLQVQMLLCALRISWFRARTMVFIASGAEAPRRGNEIIFAREDPKLLIELEDANCRLGTTLGTIG